MRSRKYWQTLRKVGKKAGIVCLALIFAGTYVLEGSAQEDASDAVESDADGADVDEEEKTSETAELYIDEENVVQITLADDGSTVSGSGASVSGNVISISEGGSYWFTGSLSDGQIVVDADGDETVVLMLAGVEITNPADAAIYVENADRAIVYLVDGTDNLIVSGENTGSSAADGEVDDTAEGGAIRAKDDLMIGGSGSLTVKGFINNGIQTSNDLTIESGTITVDAVNNGVKGKDSVTILGGTITVTAGGDGIKSDDDTGDGYGVVTIEDGEIQIECGEDGIQAETVLTISGGTIVVSQSYEGLEGNQVRIEGGDIQVTATDDGINANGGSDSWGMGWGMMGAGNGMNSNSDADTGTDASEDSSEETPLLLITGGTIWVNAQGDGLDSNADLTIEGGTIIVDGPSDSMNGSIDYGSENGGTCSISGGTILAIGASGMAENFGSSSTQCSFLLSLSSNYAAGSVITICDAEGNALFEHTSERAFSSIIYSSADLEEGGTYQITVDSDTTEITLTSVTGSYSWSGESSGTDGFGNYSGKMGGGRMDSNFNDSMGSKDGSLQMGETPDEGQSPDAGGGDEEQVQDDTDESQASDDSGSGSGGNSGKLGSGEMI